MIEAAVSQCLLTLKSHADTSPEGIQKLIAAFEPFGVSKAQIEKFCQCRADAIKPAQIVRLRKVYSSLKDGMSSPEEWFEPEEKKSEEPPKKLSLKDKLKERKEAASVQSPAEASPDPAPAQSDVPDEDWVKAYAQGA